MNKFRALAIILQLAIVGLADAATIESLVGGNWNVGATWVGGNVPAAGDNVVIKNTHSVNVTADHSIIGITVEAGASLIVNPTFSLTTTGNIIQDGTFSVNGTLNLNSGTHTINVANSFSGSGILNINGTNVINSSVGWVPSVTTVNHNGTINGTAAITIPSATTWNWSTGHFGLTGIITNNGTLILNGGVNMQHNIASELLNNGTINWIDGHFDGGSGGQTLTNNVSGIFNCNAIRDNNEYHGLCNVSINNSGTVNRTTTGFAYLNLPFNNLSGGSVLISTGGLRLFSVTQSGTFTNNGGINLNGGTHTINVINSFSGSGFIDIENTNIINSSVGWAPAVTTVNHYGTINGTAAITIPSATTWNWSTGHFGLTGIITNNGTLILNGGVNMQHNIASELLNNGTINWIDGHFDGGSGGQTLTNNVSGIFNCNAIRDNNEYHGLCNVSINNSGTVNRTTTGFAYLNLPFNNLSGGSVLISTGGLRLFSVTQSGTFTNNGGINLNGGTHTINVINSFSGSGFIDIENTNIINSSVGWAPAVTTVNHYGTINGTAAITIPSATTWNWSTGHFGLTGIITNNGTLILNGGVNMQHNIASELLNNGTINWIDGHFDGGSGGQTLTNNVSGIFNCNAIRDNNEYHGLCNVSINNSGTVNRTTTGFAYLNLPFNNLSGGSVLISTGGLRLFSVTQSGTFTNNGGINLNGGTHTINVINSFSGSGFIDIENTNIINSSVGWAPAVTTVNHYGTINGTAAITIPSATTWNWSTGHFGLTGIITNNGTLILNGGVNMQHNIASELLNNGTINWIDGHFDGGSGGQTLTNNVSGIFNCNAIYDNNAYHGICNISIINSGTVNRTTTGFAILNLPFTNLSGGSVLNIQTGSLNFSNTLTNTGAIKGTGTLNVSGGTFTNSGTVAPGLSPGTLNIVGNYTNSALALEINYSGGIVTKDSLYVSGNVTLGGSLVLTQTGNVPSGNYVFLKSGGTTTGTFSSVTLPDCYTIEYGATTVTLKKGIAKVWDGTVNQWDEPTHWNPNGVPCPYDDVIINSGICELNITPDMKSLTINGGTLKKIDPATYSINVKTTVAAAGFINAFEGTIDFNDTLNNNGTIQGYANIDIVGATMIGGYGKWAPGNSTGVLGCKGTYNNEVIEMEIQGPGSGGGTVEVDFLSVSQTMLVDDDLVVKWLGGTIPPGIRTIMQCDGGGSCRTGEFFNVSFPPQCPTGKCKILYNGTQVQLENTEPIEFMGTCTWLGGSGNWSTVNKWSCNDVPNANDDVVINSGVVTLDIPTAVKSLNITGGSVVGSNNLSVVNAFLWSGGSFSAGTDFSIGAATLSGNISLSNTSMILSQGGTFNNPTLTLSSNASIVLPATKTLTLNNQGTINNDNGFNFVNNGTIIKNGSGVFTFKNPFVNNGITNISAGTIKYDNNFTSTGLLKGNGFIDFTAAGNVQIGPVNPGSSPGTFHVTGNYTNKHFLAEMLHSASVTTHDRIDVTSNIQLQDSITIIKLAGEDIPYGTYTLMHCDGSASCVTGNFVTVKYPAFCGGADCSLMISGQDVKFVFQASLPVELSAFDARKLGSSVRLDWTTSSEVNVREFIIERSSNTASWAELGSITARGNSTESLKYFYFDNDPVAGNNFYRLRIIDQDGSFKYSPIVNVAYESAGNMQLFPNPVNQILTIRPPSNAEGNLWIVNSSGQTVIRQSLLPGEEVQINVANLPSGLYAVCIPGIPCKSFVKE